MKLAKILVPLALLPVALSAQSTIFHTDFSTDTLNQASFTPTSTSTAWNIASTKNATSSVGASGLSIGLPSTSSGFVEAQTVFSNTPYQLATTGDKITATITFTATNNILTGGTGSQIFVGLFQSGGSTPLANLQSSGLSTTTGSANATGGTQLWQGFNSRISYDGGGSGILTRAQQSGAGTTSANQELVFQGGGGGYANPAGTLVATDSTTAATAALTNGNTYTLVFEITRTNATTLSITNNLFDGAGTAGTNLATLATSVTGTNLLTDTFDGLGFGYRFSNTAAASSLNITDVLISSNVSAIPEPATYAAILGIAGLAVVAIRRRRR